MCEITEYTEGLIIRIMPLPETNKTTVRKNPYHFVSVNCLKNK